MASLLSDCRQSVWDAIDAYAPLDGAFQQTYRYNDDPGRFTPIEDPSYAKMPALSIYPAAPSDAWVLNQAREFVYVLQFRMWTAGTDLRAAELLLQRIFEAVWQGFQNNAAGTEPGAVSIQAPVRLAQTSTGKICTRWEWTQGFHLRPWTPLTTN